MNLMNGSKNCKDVNPIQRLIKSSSPSDIWTERCQKELDRLLVAEKFSKQLKELKEEGSILDTRILKLIESYNEEIDKINSNELLEEQADVMGC